MENNSMQEAFEVQEEICETYSIASILPKQEMAVFSGENGHFAICKSLQHSFQNVSKTIE
jgi:hypothetical protein